MAWWVTALIYVVGTLLYEVLRPKPKFDAPTPSALGDFQFPTIGEGRPIPIVWGTCKLAGPMVTWYGDLEVQAIKERVKTGLFSSTDVTTGYRYSLGMQLVLCSGEIDEVLEIRFDDRVPENAVYTVAADRTEIAHRRAEALRRGRLRRRRGPGRRLRLPRHRRPSCPTTTSRPRSGRASPPGAGSATPCSGTSTWGRAPTSRRSRPWSAAARTGWRSRAAPRTSAATPTPRP